MNTPTVQPHDPLMPEYRQQCRKKWELQDRILDGFREAPESADSAMLQHLRATNSEAYARRILGKKGIEAFQTRRALSISGNPYLPGDVLLLWPSKPVTGFATRKQLSEIPEHDLEPQADGTLLALTSVVIAGKRYREGDLVRPWPDKPTPGFITASVALELLEQRDIEPVELTSSAE